MLAAAASSRMGSSTMTLLIGSPVLAVMLALGVLVVLLFATVMLRVNSFSRHIDQRRARRWKFQDEWSAVIKTGGWRSRGERN